MSDLGPVESVERFIEAVNTGNADEAASLTTEGTTITTPDGDVITGISGAQGFVRALASRHALLRLDSCQVTGNLVTGILELANDYHREVGVAPLYVELQAAVRDGKILTFGGPFTADSIEKLRPLREKSGE